ncbi:MAG TPA: phage protease, partial [Phycisphaerae bacterium]|nr:phage protease [Phycisphaerae bacterium]
MIGEGEIEIRCELAASAPQRVVICPWGEFTVHGQRVILDDQAAAATIAAVRARRVDTVIDYEHQTEGGKFASPDGTAPASGWIKGLSVQPGVGLVADVQWTPRAARMIAAREYRYLSPVLTVSKTDGRVVGIRSVALTNAPAIDGFPAMVASQRGGEKENGMHVAETASTARADRAALIARAREAYAKHGEALARLTDEASFVSCSLQDLGEERLTEEEVASLRVANDRRRRAERDTVIAKARREYIEHPALCRLTSEEAFVS